MKHQLQILAGCLTAAALFAPVAEAARAKKAPSPTPGASASPAASAAASPATKATTSPTGSPMMKMPRAIPFRGMIASVDMRAKTFTIAGKEKSRVFKMTDKTVFMKAGMAATMKDVVEKEEVRGSYWKATDGTLEAKTVKLGPLTAEEQVKKDARKAKRAEKKAAATPAESPAASPSPKP
ncbi:MAG: hypothetical protein ABI944_04935 [Chthoniobacterales bacterium]